MKVGVDLDGVVVNFVKGFIPIVKRKYGLNLREEDIYNHDLFLVLGITEEEAKELIYETLVQDLDLYQGAKEGLKQLKRKHEIYILTARPHDLIDVTRDWLKNKNIPYDRLLCLEQGLKHLANLELDVVVEDNLKDAIGWSAKTRVVLIFDHPWNKSFNVKNNFVRIKNWSEIIKFISELEMRPV